MNFPKPIDAVYTWVNGNCPTYQQLCRQYSENQKDLNPERYRDQYSLLMYSLRSLEKYVPWINNIYLFTCRPQVPEWLNLNHPQIKIVHHDQVIDSEYLPTFNCNVIETYLHKIPFSADYLLYLNDDFLFGNQTTKSDFITPDGRIKVLGTLFGEKLGFRVYENKGELISLGLIEHTPLLIYKPYWEAMLKTRLDEVKATRKNKFRTDRDLQMDKLYRYFLRSHQAKNTEVVPIYQLLRYHRFHKIINNFSSQKSKLEKLKKMQPKFYCLNDDQRDNPNPQVVELVQNFLDSYYPCPSQFEK
ncbi:MAG: Stealth CR1 domain-containing protein [Oscillatoria sp. PMC 1068.18]|nr:Stealth CR1 domain-containing protein [Oscillatoria sp. PMC 1076.18]MEC4990342.1 Stealth CR1 domain-containing protein [Oscillatoria sp. PMC 1068.18]